MSAPIYVRVDGGSFWKPSAVPEIVERLKRRMMKVLEPNELDMMSEKFKKQWRAQHNALKERIRRASMVYDRMLRDANSVRLH